MRRLLVLVLSLLCLPAGPATAAEPLEGTDWQLRRVVWRDSDGDRRMMRVAPDVRAGLVLQGGAVDLRTGCNSGFGSADIDDDVLAFGEISLTMVGCVGKAARVERRMLRVLREGESAWSLRDDVLRLERGVVRLVLTAT